MKHIVSLTLAFCMALSLFTVGVSADAPDHAPELAQRTYAILSENSAGVTIKAPCAARVLFAVYDARGRMLGVSVSDKVAAGQSVDLSVSCVPDKVARGAAFFLDDNWRPAAEALDVSIPVVSMNEVFGLSKNLRFVENPKTEAELAGNVLYCFAHGKYEINLKLSPDMPTSHWSSPNVKSVANSLPELAGMFSNQRLQFRCENNKLVFWYDGRSDLSAVEPAACYERQKQAYFKALEIHDQLHESGKITDGMTQRQIAQVYYDYMVAKNVGPAHGPDGTVAEKVFDDSAYAALCTNAADCVGRAAAFNMLLHTEGIACCGVSGQLGGGHVLNYMVLDGTPYLGDWGNRMGMAPVKSFSNRFVPEKLSLEFAERVIKGDYSGLLLGAPMTVKLAGDKKLTVTVPSLEGAELDDIRFRFDSDRVGNTARGSALSLSGSTLTVDLSGFNLSDEQWESILNTGWFRLEIKSCYWHAPSLTK